MRRIFAAVAAVSLALALAACGGGGSSGSGDITIGLLAPLTGGVASTAEDQERVVELAVNEFNDAGGVDGKKVKLKTYDTQLQPEVAAQQAQRAITQDRVAAMIGPFSTSEALAVATLADRSKVAIVTGSASTEAITQDTKYMYRAAPLSGDLAAGLIQTAQKLGVKNAVLMYDSGGSGLAFKPLVQSAAKEAGLPLTQSIQYPLSASDVSAEVTKAARNHPQAVFIAGSNGADYGLIIKTMVEQGLDVPVLGFSPIVLPDAIDIAAGGYDKLPGVYTVEGADTTKPEYRALLKKYNATYDPIDNLPEQVLGAYDATEFVLEALKESGGKGGDELAKALESLPPRVGANGKKGAEEQFTADKHDAFEGVYVVPYKVVNGKPQQDTSLALN